jgi:S1-C subfamily serine protease
MGPDDDADEVPAGPPPPPAERPWRHPSELDERRSPGPPGPGAAKAGPRRPGLWFVLTASALVGTVVAVIAVGLVSEMRPEAKGGDASAGSGPAVASTLVGDAPAVNEGRTLGPTITRGPVADRPWLGIQGTDGEGAVLVTGVTESGPAATAGIEPGDLIVAAQREAIETMAALQGLIARLEPGAVLVLDLLRGETRIRVMAVLGVWD